MMSERNQPNSTRSMRAANEQPGQEQQVRDRVKDIKSPIEHISPRKCVARFGMRERWWQRKLRELYEAGRISKKGRAFFGSMSDIEQWLTESELDSQDAAT